MRVAVRLSDEQKVEWLSKQGMSPDEIYFFKAGEQWPDGDADVYFDLLYGSSQEKVTYNSKPVFVNAVMDLLSELPENFIRINAWNGFLERKILEIVASPENKAIADAVMQHLGWAYIFSVDIKGMIVARSISMIVNEAYFALESNVSSKEEIDTAMRLGTNYPHGPFEWGKKIGLINIYNLLYVLYIEDNRYIASSLLRQEAFNAF